jgi:hypothetical protein
MSPGAAQTCVRGGLVLGVLAVLQPLASCAPAGQSPTDINDPLPLPFAVSDYFTPTGAEGDAESPSYMSSSNGCASRAPAPGGPYGDCYAVTYAAPNQMWGGIYWQFPANNWGTSQGRRVSAGATKCTLWARADVSSPLALSFGVGGEGGTTEQYADNVGGGLLNAMVTSDWQEFSFPVTGTYDWVLSGFHFSVTWGNQPVTFYLDSIQWQ